jgi:hypothetical protein
MSHLGIRAPCVASLAARRFERSIRALLIRVARFGQHRAATAHDRLWAAATADGLRALVADREREVPRA